jgi:hypothetical protein
MLSVYPCCCSWRVKFTGCNSLPLANYQIDLYAASGGMLLQSVTTDISGYASINYPGPTWAQSHDGRFSGNAFAVPPTTIALTNIASGYACRFKCAIPISKTTHFTDVNGTWTLQYDGGSNWIGCGSNAAMPNVITSFDVHCNEVLGNGAVAYSISVNKNSEASCEWVTFFGLGPSQNISSFGNILPGSSDPACFAGILGWTAPACAAADVKGLINASGTVVLTCPPAFSTLGAFGAIGFAQVPNVGAFVETE